MSSEKEEVVVYLDAPELGAIRPVGVLTRWPGHALSVGWQYAASWLRGGASFPIDPALPLTEYLVTIPGRRVPGVFADTTPDAWGEALLRRREGRELNHWDLLVAVADETRMGALRLRRGPDGPWISDRDPAIPPVTSLRALQDAARRFEEDPDAPGVDAAIAGLIAPGSSLGGARPKANYRAPDGSLWIAKFPSKTDRRDVGTWEHVYLSLARAAGVVVPDTEILSIGPGGRTFATRRFDRMAGGRRLYASALTLSARTSTEDADYADIARAITGNVTPAAVREDLAQMYRRLAFNVLAGNRDDHLRNHGFLRLTDGWRLAPAFDLNPAREMRQHATAVNGRTVAPTADDVLATRAHFGLTEDVARVIVSDVVHALTPWREIARQAGIGRGEISAVAGAFSALDATMAARVG